jgi:flagellar motility protein MotE (MotC chaperone)
VKANILPIVGSLIGALMYLAVTAAVLIKGYKPPKPPAPKVVKLAENDMVDGSPYAGKTVENLTKEEGPSWNFYNPEVDELINYLRQASNTFQMRKKELDELGQRIAAERAELASVTQSVVRLREEIDRHLIQIQGDEAANVKRLAKTYAGMEPASVAKVFAEMDEKLVVKVMSQMKDDQNGLILEVLAKTDAQKARLAASLSDKLRLVPTTKKP